MFLFSIFLYISNLPLEPTETSFEVGVLLKLDRCIKLTKIPSSGNISKSFTLRNNQCSFIGRKITPHTNYTSYRNLNCTVIIREAHL